MSAGPKEDLTGQIFGKLTVLEWKNFSKRPTLRWLVRCACGNELYVATAMLKNGHTKTCRKCPRHKDFSGQIFGQLTALEIDHIRTNPNGQTQTMWKMLCTCGGLCVVAVSHLTDGGVKSCGCLMENMYPKKPRKKATSRKSAQSVPTNSIKKELRTLPEYRDWKWAVYARDSNCCQVCGVRKSNKVRTEAHHIVTVDDIVCRYELTSIDKAKECQILWDITNGITLCYRCHKNVHNPYFITIC